MNQVFFFSNQLGELKVILKGKAIESEKLVHKTQKIDNEQVQQNFSENFHVNTPITEYQDPQTVNDNFVISKQPAIIAKLGTAETVKMSDRPKPFKKTKSSINKKEKKNLNSLTASPFNDKDYEKMQERKYLNDNQKHLEV